MAITLSPIVRADIIEILKIEAEIKKPGLTQEITSEKLAKRASLQDNLMYPDDVRKKLNISPMTSAEIDNHKKTLAPEVISLQNAQKKAVSSWFNKPKNASTGDLKKDVVEDANRRHSDPGIGTKFKGMFGKSL